MPNHLAYSKSLYLRKHADNPINWWPWCDEALAKAKQDDKPIFLSIGYSSCHWCTVMEGEAFSDQAIAQYMNEQFVAIKVDREERPDLDSIYMQALQMMTGHGGWPLNVFLTPGELVPFYGGTYFPVEPRYNRPGFLRILQSLRHFYNTDKEKLESVQGEILQRLQSGATLQSTEPLADGILWPAIELSAKGLLAGEPGPRFPAIPQADLVLRGSRFHPPEGVRYDPLVAARRRGSDLALGGIFDHVAGGFHRYTVDPSWTVPHFEKMLYDNGQIMEYLANLWSTGLREPAFERAIAKTVEWLQREMIAPEGYFYASQDADSFITVEDAEPEEGAFYVWRYEELTQWLEAEALEELQDHFTVTTGGNFDGQNVLQRITTDPLSVTLDKTLAILYNQRYGDASPPALTTTTVLPPARTNQEAKSVPWLGRIPPVTDTKMIVAWNSLMISGLARAATVFNRRSYVELAAKAATFILAQQRIEHRLHRLNYDGVVSVSAQSEDYALFIKALLDIDQAVSGLMSVKGDDALLRPLGRTWVEHAIALQSECDQWLWSVEQGGYYNTARDAADDLIVRERNYSDNATPSANGIAAANLIRLFLYTDTADYLEQAEQIFKAFSAIMTQVPQACPSLFAALDWYHNPVSVKLRSARQGGMEGESVGSPAINRDDEASRNLSLHQAYLPTTVIKYTPDLPDGAVGLVCQGMSCDEPALQWEQLMDQVTAAHKHLDKR